MKLALICTYYPPQRSSCAVQMRDLARELAAQGHQPVVLVPSDLAHSPADHADPGVQVVRLKSPETLGGGYLRRTLAEFIVPFAMLRGLRRSAVSMQRWDAVIWYSPSIFFGPLVWSLKRRSGCPTYLILRDLFPEWALDLGLLRKGPVYYFFRAVARFQYSVANVIGVQTESNLEFLRRWADPPRRELQVLRNWLGTAENVGSSFNLEKSPLRGRTMFVYVGNMGVAQGMDVLVELAARMRDRHDVGFLFVGRGSEVTRMMDTVRTLGLTNTLILGEMDSGEMPGLLAQCHIGLIALDPRHKTHNVPGKFLTYMREGVPVLARVNPGTDIAALIENEQVGRAFVGSSLEELLSIARQLVDDPVAREKMGCRARALGSRMFASSIAARQIVQSLVRHAAPAKQP